MSQRGLTRAWTALSDTDWSVTDRLRTTGDGRIRLPAKSIANGHPWGLADSSGGRLVPCWQSVVMSTAWDLTIDCAPSARAGSVLGSRTWLRRAASSWGVRELGKL